MGRAVRVSLALVSGVLLALAFPPLEWAPLAFVALVPLLFAVRGERPARAFLLGWLFGLAFFTGVVWWVSEAVIHYGYLPPPVGWAVLLLMTSILAVYPGIFASVAARAQSRGLAGSAAGVLLLAAAWTGLEWVRGSFFFMGFPWANLAYSQYRWLAFIQSASLAGPWGTGFVIAAVNAGLFSACETVGGHSGSRRRALLGFALSLLLAAATWGFGAARLAGDVPLGNPVSVAVLQGNIPQDVKWDEAFREETIRAYEGLTREAAGSGADLVIWPESAAPFYFQNELGWQRRLLGLVRETGRPLLFGSPAFEVVEGKVALRNRVWYVRGTGELAGFYDKLHLVPFGEYVPFSRILFFAGKLVSEVGNFTPGTSRRLFDLDGERFGAVICYEIIFPDLVRRFVRDGATFMTTVTNDAWYGRTSASWQHFTQMVFRAVENGVPVARAANTGISGFVDHRGRILQMTPLFERGGWTARIRPGRGRTLYTLTGDLFAWLCLAAVAAWVLLGLVPRRRRFNLP